jgi:hypothetical protein
MAAVNINDQRGIVRRECGQTIKRQLPSTTPTTALTKLAYAASKCGLERPQLCQ